MMPSGSNNGIRPGRRGRVPDPARARYTEFLSRLREGEAGKLILEPEESVLHVRRQLSAAARASGKRLATRRDGETLYFWVAGDLPAHDRGRVPVVEGSEPVAEPLPPSHDREEVPVTGANEPAAEPPAAATDRREGVAGGRPVPEPPAPSHDREGVPGPSSASGAPEPRPAAPAVEPMKPAPPRARPTYIAEVPRLPAPPQQVRFRRGR